MSAESRAKLSAQQASLMQALTANTPLEGFDTDRFRATAISLQQKRIRTAERAHPCKCQRLSSRFWNSYFLSSIWKSHRNWWQLLSRLTGKATDYVLSEKCP